MRTVYIKKFDTIVRQYKAMRTKYRDMHTDFCVHQKSLGDAIDVAAKAINYDNKIHDHQHRIGRIKLNTFATKLKTKESEIKNSKTFDELLAIIEAVKCEGIAELTYYDTATRIGAYLDIFPDKIYLHAGTKVGAKQLVGDLKKRKFIAVSELPDEFLKYDLTASEFEDILCIFKIDLGKL
jgi:hypothetical protein